MRQNFSENWFSIIKSTLVKDEDEGRPRPADNPLSLYSLREIEQEYDEEYDFRQIYGGTYPSRYLGNYKPLGGLRADYNISYPFGDKIAFDYGITEIEFRVVLSHYHTSKRDMLDIFVVVHSNNGIKSLSWDADEEIKVLSDFVEIYNQPNHKYKNLTARIVLQGKFKNHNLKHVINSMRGLTNRERYLLTRLKV